MAKKKKKNGKKALQSALERKSKELENLKEQQRRINEALKGK